LEKKVDLRGQYISEARKRMALFGEAQGGGIYSGMYLCSWFLRNNLDLETFKRQQVYSYYIKAIDGSAV